MLHDVSGMMWNVRHTVYLQCGMFGIWDIRDVGYSGCGKFGIRDVWDVRCLGCGMFEGLDVGKVRCLGIWTFVIWKCHNDVIRVKLFTLQRIQLVFTTLT